MGRKGIRAAWDGFARFLEADTPPPLSEADARQRDDEDWTLAAMAFTTAKQEVEGPPRPVWRPPGRRWWPWRPTPRRWVPA